MTVEEALHRFSPEWEPTGETDFELVVVCGEVLAEEVRRLTKQVEILLRRIEKYDS